MRKLSMSSSCPFCGKKTRIKEKHEIENSNKYTFVTTYREILWICVGCSLAWPFTREELVEYKKFKDGNGDKNEAI